MVWFGVDSENVGDMVSEVVVDGVRVGVVNVIVEVDFVGVGVGGRAAAAHFVVVCGVAVLVCEVVLKAASPLASAAASAALIGNVDVVGEGVGGMAAAAHFVVVVGVVGVRDFVGVIVGEGVGGMAAAAHFVVVAGVVEE